MLYKAWKKWCEDNGRDRPGSAQMFGRNLQSVVPQARRFRPRAEKKGRQVLTYLGIGLKPDAIPRDADESKSRNGEHRVSPQLTDSDRDSESGVSRLSRGETRSNPLQLLHRTSLSGHACRVCGEAIDPAAGDVHPGCDTEVPR